MSNVLPVLQAAPDLQLRRELVQCPEIGGSVWVHGLLASEAFAVTYLRSQALRRVHEAGDEYRARVKALPPEKTAPPFEPPELDLAEAKAYGRYQAELLALAVRLENGLALYTADQWDIAGQHHPALLDRLVAVAERLSGLHKETVEKNSTATPS